MKNGRNTKEGISKASVLLLCVFAIALASISIIGVTQQVSLKAGRVINVTTTTPVSVPTVSVPAFQGGSVVSFVIYQNSTCSPSPASSYPNSPYSLAASAYTSCFTGTGAGVYIAGATPRYNLIPAFAGMSIYGNTTWGATSQGYPTYNGMTIITQCGASGTASSCAGAGKPGTYFFSPQYVINEQSIGIYNGIGNVPEGVLPSAAHDFLLPATKNGTVSRSYRVSVAVYDPNIFPNASGVCKQLVASNQTNPTQNCLTSTAALQAAITTYDSAAAAANANNKIWHNAGNITTQAAIVLLNATTLKPYAVLNISAVNTNLQSYSYVSGPYTTSTSTSTSSTSSSTTTAPSTSTSTTTSVSTTVQSTTTPPSSSSSAPSSNTLLYVGIVVVIVIIVLVVWKMMGKKT